MAWKDIRDEIKTLLLAVTDIGQVHVVLRHTTHWEEVFARHKDAALGELRDWEITRTAEELELEAFGNLLSTEPFYRRTHQVLIQGVLAVDDKEPPDHSEEVFQDLVEAVVTKLRQNNLLNEKVLLHIEPQVTTIGHDTFAGVLVHRAEIRFPAIERVGG